MFQPESLEKNTPELKANYGRQKENVTSDLIDCVTKFFEPPNNALYTICTYLLCSINRSACKILASMELNILRLAFKLHWCNHFFGCYRQRAIRSDLLSIKPKYSTTFTWKSCFDYVATSWQSINSQDCFLFNTE